MEEKDHRIWTIVSAVELMMAAIVILLDLLVPTLIILAMMVVSLIVRKEKLSSLGFKKLGKPGRVFLIVLVLVIVWTVLHLSIFIPVSSHLTGTTQDLSAYEELKGNVGQLVFLLIATWTLAAFGEEFVYRGYIQKRVRDVLGDTKVAIIVAVAVTSLLFGAAHLEQGTVGFILTAIDAVFFSALKLKYDDNLWASIFAHGLSNTVGMIAVFFVGPIYGLW